MKFYRDRDIKNVLINQIFRDSEKDFFTEILPTFEDDTSTIKTLSLNENRDLVWRNPLTKNDVFNSIMSTDEIILKQEDGTLIIDCSISYIEDDKLKGTNLYCSGDRMGFGREPLRTYKFDIAIPKDTLTTALHVGDGSAGFSMGNGTSQGFIPQIIGMGSDENDAGLYFLGAAGNNLPSDIPLIIFDGRDVHDSSLNNRPILGITSGDYSNYTFLVNYNGDTFTQEKTFTKDIVFNDTFESLKNIIKDLQKRVQDLENQLES
jgi:hypothetical protein